ncbi:MAG: GH25 family lysozyme [Eubacterium sp.]
MKKLLYKSMCLLIAVIMAFSGTFIVSASEPAQGYDISGYNEGLTIFNDSNNFVMIRIGCYTDYDYTFVQNVIKAVNAKMNFGVYLSSMAENEEQAQQEAEFVISKLSSTLGDYQQYFKLPVAISFLEYENILPDDNTAQMTTFCDIISDAGYTPMVCADSNFFNNNLDSSVIASKGYKVWYSEEKTNPDFTTPIKVGNTDLNADMWQYSISNAKNVASKNVIYNPDSLIKSIDCLHSYTSAVTTPDSCTSNGVTTNTCTKCGNAYDTVIYTTGHKYVDRWILATCTTDGRKDKKCTRCGDVIIGETITKTGHKYEITDTEPATCTKEGRITYTCTNANCGDTYYEVINKTEHNYQDYYLAPTCTQKGINGKKCSGCGDVIAEEEIPLKSHSYKTTTAKATTSKDGKIVKACTECGQVASTTVIYKASSIKLEATTLTYNGKVRTPRVYIKDSKGKTISSSNYTVTYASGRKNVGKYAVKITFKGNYSGTKTLYFTIKPKATSISSVSAKSKGFTVKWKKQSTQVTGYQIQYSTSSKFTSPKYVTVSSYKTTSKTISKLKSKKKYYIRIRTYKTVSGTKYYSSWSKAKSVTTKK